MLWLPFGASHMGMHSRLTIAIIRDRRTEPGGGRGRPVRDEPSICVVDSRPMICVHVIAGIINLNKINIKSTYQ